MGNINAMLSVYRIPWLLVTTTDYRQVWLMQRKDRELESGYQGLENCVSADSAHLANLRRLPPGARSIPKYLHLKNPTRADLEGNSEVIRPSPPRLQMRRQSDSLMLDSHGVSPPSLGSSQDSCHQSPSLSYLPCWADSRTR